jgi:asparagine synthase (glutamine-hydrolysing)
LFSEGETKPVKTFCVGYNNRYQSYDSEFEYARKAADCAKAEHYQQELSLEDLVNFYPTMIHLQDEPIADWVCFPLYYVSKLAKRHGITVCQAGEGADELFFGYPWWLKVNRNQAILRALKALMPGPALSKYMRFVNSYFENAAHRIDMNAPIFWGGAECFTDLDKSRLLTPNFLRSLNTATSWSVIAPIYEEFLSYCPKPDNVLWMTYLETRLRLPELLLMRLDKMTMACSLEGRVPFLDHKLVELSMSIPSKVKVNGKTTKPVLKRAVRGLIPDEIIDRKKQGFGIPIGDWAREGLTSILEKEIRYFNAHTEIFRPNVIEDVLKSQNTLAIWVLGNLACWWKHWIAQETLEIGPS